MNAIFWKYLILVSSVAICLGMWAFFAYTFPENVPVEPLIDTLRMFLVGAGASFLALLKPPSDPTATAPVTQ